VPFAERRSAVSVLSHDPRERNAVVGNERRIAGEPGGELADRAKTDRVAAAAGQQRRPRGRAQRRDVEAVVAHTLLRDPRVVRCVDRPAKRAGIPKTGVIDQDEQDVRSAVGSPDVPEFPQSGCEPSRVLLATP